MKYIFNLRFLLLLFFVFQLSVKAAKQDKNTDIFYLCVEKLTEKRNLPINELLVKVGQYFLGQPYVAATLEGNVEEQLVVNLSEFDCTTFVESCLTLAQELKYSETPSYQGYKDKLKQIRYRDGEINGYTSRLHYITDWSIDNDFLLENITLQLGGEQSDKPFSFMSEHPHLYPLLKNNAGEVERIREIEVALEKENRYFVLPKDKLKNAFPHLQTGDIVVFATRIKGLDYSHIGLIINDNGLVNLLHASSAGKQILVDSKNLYDYCMSAGSCTGITVLRLKNLQ